MDVEESKAHKKIEDVDTNYKQNATVYEFTLKKAIEPSTSEVIELTEHYYKRFKPLPKEIKLEVAIP